MVREDDGWSNFICCVSHVDLHVAERAPVTKSLRVQLFSQEVTAMNADMDLTSMQWSEQQLVVEAFSEGRPYQDDVLSMHRVVWKTMGAAEAKQPTPSHIEFNRDAKQFKHALQMRAAKQQKQRLKRAGRFAAAAQGS